VGREANTLRRREGTVVKAVVVGTVTAVVSVLVGVGLLLSWASPQTSATNAQGGVDFEPAVQVTTTSTTRPVPTTAAAELRPVRQPPLPPCAAGDEPVTVDAEQHWDRVVVDTTYRLGDRFVPSDLRPVSEAGFGNTDDYVRAVMIPDLAAMRDAARAAGAPFHVVSAFRDYGYQQSLWDASVAANGIEVATARTARPGHSEHQLGTTIDILDPGSTELTTAFGGTAAGRWVAEHGHEFGFVLSYPDGESSTTCYDYEPWHVRYVGRDVATRIHESGMSPREYLLTEGAVE